MLWCTLHNTRKIKLEWNLTINNCRHEEHPVSGLLYPGLVSDIWQPMSGGGLVSVCRLLLGSWDQGDLEHQRGGLHRPRSVGGKTISKVSRFVQTACRYIFTNLYTSKKSHLWDSWLHWSLHLLPIGELSLRLKKTGSKCPVYAKDWFSRGY